jgi:hypothetical protein
VGRDTKNAATAAARVLRALGERVCTESERQSPGSSYPSSDAPSLRMSYATTSAPVCVPSCVSMRRPSSTRQSAQNGS